MTFLTMHQQMIMARRPSSSVPPIVNAFLSTIRGGSRQETFPDAAHHIDVIQKDGEDVLEVFGIPVELRAGATLETWCGGPKYRRADWETYGVVANWKRTDSDWVLESAERRKMSGGRDKGWLTRTPEQIAFCSDQASREGYSIRARWSGDRDD